MVYGSKLNIIEKKKNKKLEITVQTVKRINGVFYFVCYFIATF